MIMYLFFATVPIMMSLIVSFRYKNSIKSNEKAKRTFLILCGIVMFLIIALRHKEIGSTDSQNYYSNWELLSGLSFNGLLSFMKETKFEVGYCFLVWCLSHIFPYGQFVFILSALLFTIAVCRFIYLYSEDPELSFVMYITLGLYSFMVQGLRQSIAMSICIFAVTLAKKRKLVSFILLVFLASTIHTSAIVFFFVYFLYGFTINIRSGVLAIIFAISLLALSSQVVALGNVAFDREYGTEVESGGYIAVAIYIIILFLSIVFAGKYRKDKDYSFFVFFTLIGAITYLMRYTEAQVAERISFYFMFGQMIALPNVLRRFDKHTAFIIKYLAIILSLLLYAYRLSGGNLIDYRFFWE